MKRDRKQQFESLRFSSSGDPQDDSEAASFLLPPRTPLISRETKRLLVLAAATTYGTCKVINLTGHIRNKHNCLKPLLQTAMAGTIAATAWAQYNRLQNNEPEVAEIDY